MKKIRLLLAFSMLLLPLLLIFAACNNINDGNSCEHVYILTEVMTENQTDIPRSARFVCSACQAEKIDTLTGKNVGMPIINFNGSLDGISKQDKVTVNVSYDDGSRIISSKATLKLQGSSSLMFPKKNYTIQFVKENGDKNKVELVSEWGSQSKYCLKANFIDGSQSRNVVSGQIYGQIAKSRNINDDYSNLVNGGAIDGFPVVVYYNDVYLGLYTLNIPKDEWLFRMKKTTAKQAILMGDDWTQSTALKELVSEDFSNGWELEYCSTEDTDGTEWVADSFNAMIKFITDNDGQSFVDGISKFINVERSLDAMIFTYVMCAEDNIAKNILWTTYNGEQWACTVYDMDCTWGLFYTSEFVSPDNLLPTQTYDNLLWEKLRKNFAQQIKDRYTELRTDILSEQNIENTFKQFFDKIPDELYQADFKKWVTIPLQDSNNFEQISSFMRARLANLDTIWLN